MPIPQIKMSAGMKAFVTRERTKVEKEAPAKKHCPKCGKDREFSFFGVRTHRDHTTGKPVRFSPQSYCVDCRSKPKASKKTTTKAKKVAAPKAPKVAKSKKTKIVTKPDPAVVALAEYIIAPKPAEILAHLTKTAAEAAANTNIEPSIPTLPANEPVIPADPIVVVAAAPEAPKPASINPKTGKKRKLVMVDVEPKK